MPDDPEVDLTQQAADKITNAATLAEEKLRDDAREAAAALSGEVVLLREELEVLRQVDSFKAKVYIVGIAAAIAEILAFFGLWFVSRDMNRDTSAIRTDLEVHRIRNEASHDCLAEKMAKLPTPEQRLSGDVEAIRQFLHEFLGCVAATAPNIVPPDAPEIRRSVPAERRSQRP